MDLLVRSLPEPLQRFDTYIDFIGDNNCVRDFWILSGYLAQQVSVAVNSVLVGFLIASVIVIPPWPFFRRNPIEWLPAQKSASTGGKRLRGGKLADGMGKKTK
ncbi:putative signal peptidase complex subunit 1 [Toxocara canis]|uniref:Signal peptidase complex subunit 1 n=1 Tax=Toxocara canis TaxID=6265 RepID=A0A0B2V2I4_TOXCA|nr:putative signal peptidase complex subunit 1 [Toxocara canis]